MEAQDGEENWGRGDSGGEAGTTTELEETRSEEDGNIVAQPAGAVRIDNRVSSGSIASALSPNEEYVRVDEVTEREMSPEEMKIELIYAYGTRTLITNTGEHLDLVSALQGKLVGLLFSSVNMKEEYGKDKKPFLQLLRDLAHEHAQSFAVVYVSQDKTEQDMIQFLRDKPYCYAIPWGEESDTNTRHTLLEQFNVSSWSLPVLVIMNPECRPITTWGKSALLSNPETCLNDWEQHRSGVSLLGLLSVKLGIDN